MIIYKLYVEVVTLESWCNMARPKKQKVEYFPHFVSSGRTIFILESTYGNDGYAFWFKLLEILGDSEGHYYDCRNSANWKFLLAKTHVDEVSAEKIIQTLIDLGQADEELWKEKVIWVQNFVDNLTELYRKRSSNIPLKPLLHTETSKEDSFRGENPSTEGNNSAKTPQRKGKESIVKDSIDKEKEREENPTPSFPTPIHEKLFDQFGETTYKTWFENTQIEEKENQIIITVKEVFKKDLIKNGYLMAISTLLGKDISVESEEGE